MKMANEKNTPLHFKVCVTTGHNKEIRRFEANPRAVSTFLNLKTKLEQVYPVLANNKFNTTWKDNEGDLIVISNDDELALALNNLGSDPFRLFITVIEEGAHEGISCHVCEEPIYGIRYLCLNCDINLCNTCEEVGYHEDHLMLRIPYALYENPKLYKVMTSYLEEMVSRYSKIGIMSLARGDLEEELSSVVSDSDAFDFSYNGSESEFRSMKPDKPDLDETNPNLDINNDKKVRFDEKLIWRGNSTMESTLINPSGNIHSSNDHFTTKKPQGAGAKFQSIRKENKLNVKPERYESNAGGFSLYSAEEETEDDRANNNYYPDDYVSLQHMLKARNLTEKPKRLKVVSQNISNAVPIDLSAKANPINTTGPSHTYYSKPPARGPGYDKKNTFASARPSVASGEIFSTGVNTSARSTGRPLAPIIPVNFPQMRPAPFPYGLEGARRPITYAPRHYSVDAFGSLPLLTSYGYDGGVSFPQFYIEPTPIIRPAQIIPRPRLLAPTRPIAPRPIIRPPLPAHNAAVSRVWAPTAPTASGGWNPGRRPNGSSAYARTDSNTYRVEDDVENKAAAAELFNGY